MKKILVVVDYQNDFVSGVLPVPLAKEISENIQREIDRDIYEKIFYTFDTHTEEEYKDSEEAKLFPKIHCRDSFVGWRHYKIFPKSALVAFGTEFLHKAEHGEYFFKKHQFDIWSGNKEYERVVGQFRKNEYEFVLVGVATNVCVAYNAIGLLERGYKVSVLSDCTRGIPDVNLNKNLEKMNKLGVIWK